MIKTLLKHTIAESAINALFDNVATNFKLNCKPDLNFKMNDRYSRIYVEYTIGKRLYATTYYKCIIIYNDIELVRIEFSNCIESTYINGNLDDSRPLMINRDTIEVCDIKMAI